VNDPPTIPDDSWSVAVEAVFLMTTATVPWSPGASTCGVTVYLSMKTVGWSDSARAGGTAIMRAIMQAATANRVAYAPIRDIFLSLWLIMDLLVSGLFSLCW
jgi:hypothetical protein